VDGQFGWSCADRRQLAVNEGMNERNMWRQLYQEVSLLGKRKLRQELEGYTGLMEGDGSHFYV
jgi:hypothetical protein